MKDYVLGLVASKKGTNEKFSAMREYLQAYTLRIMHGEGVFRTTAFVGGTALRFLYDLPRFSEDLDFSMEKAANYSFVELMRKIKEEFASAGYQVSVTEDRERTAQFGFVKFERLLYEAGLSGLSGRKFSIKIEIDTRPPKGAVLKTEVVNKYFPIAFLSYEPASLFAGKLHALLSRRYVKGRDYYDVGWYLSRWKDIVPNIPLLQNALRQTDWKGEMPAESDWRAFLYRVVEKADWKKARQDVENFLENPSDLAVFTKENVLGLVAKGSSFEK